MTQRGQSGEGAREEKVGADGETRICDVQGQGGLGGDSVGNYGPPLERGGGEYRGIWIV